MGDDSDITEVAQRLRWQPFVGITAVLASNVANAVTGFCWAVAVEFFAAANHAEEQEAFHRRAALEIEALTGGTDPLPLFAPVTVPGESDDYDDYDEDEDEEL